MVRSMFVALAVAGTALSTTVGAQTFSFETPNANYYTYDPAGYDGVTFNSKSGVAIQGSPFFSTTPPDGTQAAFIQSTSSGIGAISFALTGLTAGTRYTTTFYAAMRTGGSYPTTPLTVAYDGALLGTFLATSETFSQFTVPDFVASDTTGTLNFSGSPTTTGDDDVILDLVSVQASRAVILPGPGAVPEPASWAMMIGGFGAVGVAVRRRQRVTTRVSLAV